MAGTDVITPADAGLNPGDLRRLRKGARGAGPKFAAHIDNADKDVSGKRAALELSRTVEGKAKAADKAARKADREAAEAALAAEEAKPDTVEVTGA